LNCWNPAIPVPLHFTCCGKSSY